MSIRFVFTAPNDAKYIQEFELRYPDVTGANKDGYINEIKSKLASVSNTLYNMCASNLGGTSQTPTINVQYVSEHFDIDVSWMSSIDMFLFDFGIN